MILGGMRTLVIKDKNEKLELVFVATPFSVISFQRDNKRAWALCCLGGSSGSSINIFPWLIYS